uniref:Putative ovule protein n=1 Tax=Solanum chacoense TaxID=4108 RepID=A0A0V0HIP5_SOLCH
MKCPQRHTKIAMCRFSVHPHLFLRYYLASPRSVQSQMKRQGVICNLMNMLQSKFCFSFILIIQSSIELSAMKRPQRHREIAMCRFFRSSPLVCWS